MRWHESKRKEIPDRMPETPPQLGKNGRKLKTHCKKGHPLNLISTGQSPHQRRCLVCVSERNRRAYLARKEAAGTKKKPRKTYCIRGHRFSRDNIYWARTCKECVRLRQVTL